MVPSVPITFAAPDGLSYMNVLVIGGPIVPADIPALCERARSLLERCDEDTVLCDVAQLVQPDAAALDALARLQLAAKRLGREIRLVHAAAELEHLLVFAGLRRTVPLWEDLGVEVGGQPEQREHSGGIEEEADPGDLTV